MKRLFIYFVVSAFVLLLASCSKEENGNLDIKNEESKASSYYVKYEAECPFPYFLRTVHVNTETGTQLFRCNSSTKFSQTFGPVSKGFIASISTSQIRSTVSIYVSRNQEPFSLKVRSSCGASYQIDF